MLKHAGGRPLKWSAKNLIDAINQYFTDTPNGEYSVTGLALVVGSKQLIQDYEARDEFRDIVVEAKLVIENSYELSLRKTGKAGDIFALKNFGWKDKHEIQHTGEVKITHEQRERKLANLRNALIPSSN